MAHNPCPAVVSLLIRRAEEEQPARAQTALCLSCGRAGADAPCRSTEGRTMTLSLWDFFFLALNVTEISQSLPSGVCFTDFQNLPAMARRM